MPVQTWVHTCEEMQHAQPTEKGCISLSGWREWVQVLWAICALTPPAHWILRNPSSLGSLAGIHRERASQRPKNTAGG
jgi:hypothetical protein